MPAIDDTMGALLLGVIISAALWGVSCSQVLYYYTRYPNDPFTIKLLVAAVTTSDTIHQGLIIHSIYWYLITQFSNQNALQSLVKTMLIELIFQAITGLLVQGFFTVRVWRLSKGNLVLVIPVAAMVLTEFGVSIAYCIVALSRLATFADLAKVKPLSVCINVFSAVPDVIIAAILCTILRQSRTGLSNSNTMINRLITFTISTGLLTSICAVTSLITFLALPNTFVYICFYFLIGRLYSNSLMATLNARKSMRKGSRSEAPISLGDVHPSPALASNLAHPAGPAERFNAIAIRIDKTEETKCDPTEGDSEYEHHIQKRPLEV